MELSGITKLVSSGKKAPILFSLLVFPFERLHASIIEKPLIYIRMLSEVEIYPVKCVVPENQRRRRPLFFLLEIPMLNCLITLKVILSSLIFHQG